MQKVLLFEQFTNQIEERAPVGHTCPDINIVIRSIRSALNDCKGGKNLAERDSDFYTLFDSIESELWGVEDQMEELRTCNSKLRDWGEESEEKANSLENQVSSLEERISQLTDEISYLNNKLSRIE